MALPIAAARSYPNMSTLEVIFDKKKNDKLIDWCLTPLYLYVSYIMAGTNCIYEIEHHIYPNHIIL